VARYGALINIKDKIRTENLMLCVPKGLALKQLPMNTEEQLINGEAKVLMKTNYSIGEIKAGTVAVNIPNATFVNFISDGGANLSAGYGTNETGDLRKIPSATKAAYRSIATNMYPVTRVVRTLHTRTFADPYTLDTKNNLFHTRRVGLTMSMKGSADNMLRESGESGIGEQSVVEVLPLPVCFNPRKLVRGEGVNLRNPGQESIFRNFANDVQETEWATCASTGTSNPWTSNLMSTGAILMRRINHDNTHQAFVPPSISTNTNPVAKVLSYATATVNQLYIDNMINENKRQADGLNLDDKGGKSYKRNTYKSALSYDQLASNGLKMYELTGSSLLLGHHTDHELLEQNKENLRNGSDLYIRNGHHVFVGDYGKIFGYIQKLY
jgi:hypothetical protein